MMDQCKKVEKMLDLTKYSGKDFYSDGAIEDEILDTVIHNSKAEFDRIIKERQSWPMMYHLSSLRENIVNWINDLEQAKILEIGSGCGAITGALAKLGQSVTCVELSKRRSLINANRNCDYDNILIKVGNYQEIEPDLDNDFDIITLIGVFEYSESYIHNERPYELMLEKAKRHLKAGGKLIIAIENKLGLKYWAGCKEDHTGLYFEGLEGYPNSSGVKTFGKKELVSMFDQSGFTSYKFYYPYPDYKFATDIFSDEYLPKKHQLENNMRNFDGERMQLFDETRVFNTLLENDLFTEFSNSFLVILEK